MNDIKLSNETHIRWSVDMKNSIVEVNSEPILTIYTDGRVVCSDRLKPDQIATLVLDQIKTQWMADSQATKIRKLEDYIKKLEEFGDQVQHNAILDEDVLTTDEWDKIKEERP